jgi:hypothetical protein
VELENKHKMNKNFEISKNDISFLKEIKDSKANDIHKSCVVCDFVRLFVEYYSKDGTRGYSTQFGNRDH